MDHGLCSEITCPWWLLPTFDNPFRRLLHPADRILAPYVRPGDRVLEPGCGGGYFTIPLARLVGTAGQVQAIDVQERMLSGLRVRALRLGVSDRIRPTLCAPDRLGAEGPFDFALAFWMVHEVPDREGFLREILGALRPGGRMLVVEPRIHVSEANFERTAEIAWNTGFRVASGPKVRFSRTMELVRL